MTQQCSPWVTINCVIAQAKWHCYQYKEKVKQGDWDFLCKQTQGVSGLKNKYDKLIILRCFMEKEDELLFFF